MRKVVRVALVSLTLMASPCAFANGMDALIKQGYEARTTDPKVFASTLERLDKLEPTATDTQRQHIQLLHAYQQAVVGQYSDAIKRAIAVYESATDADLRFRAALLVANTAAITRDYSLGLRYLETALSFLDTVKDSELRDTGYGVAAVLYNQCGQFALGQRYADMLLAKDLTDRNRCYTRELRIEALHGMSAATDERELKDAIADCAAQKEPIASNLLRGYLARHWASHGRTQDAIDLLESSIPQVEATGYPRLMGEINGLLAEYRLIIGDYDGAEQHARRALEKGGVDRYSLPLVTAHKVLYETALHRGDLQAALDEYRRYAETDKARLDEVKAREFAFHLSRQELQQKNQAIELLKKQNEVLKLQQEVTKKASQNFQLLIALLAVVLASVGYWAYKVKRVQMAFRRLAHTDALTGISNRTHFRQQALTALAQSEARAEPVGMIVFDLDEFKSINDRYGHAGGDWVLEQVAAVCRTRCRKGDLFGRLGGEEFALLLTGCDVAAAERIAEQCRESLAGIDTVSLGEQIAITASFGCTSSVESGHAFERLLAHADQAMYCAKRGGRDRVSRYGAHERVLKLVPDATPA